MWRSALNIQTEIIMKSWEEYEAAVKAGGYDVVRRGIVMQTTDELTNLRMLFQQDSQPAELQTNAHVGTSRSRETSGHEAVPREPREGTTGLVDSESQALKELKAVPIYFASSYALVKPYVSGFDANVLDAPSLKRTRIDLNWTERRTARLLYPR
jgi:ABC-type oligopeptide transport system substrate-binding subunit